MISSLHLNKLLYFTLIIYIFAFNFTLGVAAVDIWEKKKKENEQGEKINVEKDITIESPILSDEVNKIIIKIDENQIGDYDQSVIGIFDPEENNFSLNMWLLTDGEDIKKNFKQN